MRMKEYSNEFKQDDKISFRRNNFKDMAAAVEYTKDMMLNLSYNLELVDNAVIGAYAQLSQIPINIQAIPDDDYVEHKKVLIEILSRIRIAEVYLNSMRDKILDYYDVAVYETKLSDKITQRILKELVDYVDTEVDGVEVHYDDLSNSPTMVGTECNNDFKFFKQL